MKSIIGLGNPGVKYRLSRHNIGFLVVDFFARQAQFPRWRRRFYGTFTQKEDLLLLLPQTYMNLSGKSVQSMLRKYPISPREILVVHDDVDIPFGEIRFKEGGSSAGHKGLNSIIAVIGSSDFARLRFGIGRDLSKETEDYVLEPFSDEEQKALPMLLKVASEGIELWKKGDIQVCMTIFNRKNWL